MSELTYLAAPYSHPDTRVRWERYRQINQAAAFLMQRGQLVYSPISHSHAIAVEHNLPTGWDYWERLDRAMLAACGSLTLLKIDGWDQSVGVRHELEIAEELGLVVVEMRPGECGIVEPVK